MFNLNIHELWVFNPCMKYRKGEGVLTHWKKHSHIKCIKDFHLNKGMGGTLWKYDTLKSQ